MLRLTLDVVDGVVRFEWTEPARNVLVAHGRIEASGPPAPFKPPKIENIKTGAPEEFTPPGEGDWALMLDDATENLPAPGTRPAESR